MANTPYSSVALNGLVEKVNTLTAFAFVETEGMAFVLVPDPLSTQPEFVSINVLPPVPSWAR